MAAAHHPHVVRVHDTVEEREHGFVIMELVDGTDLKRYVSATGALPCMEALSIAIQVCQALQALHALGLIHRDVKPHNILRASSGWVKLADFGLAQPLYPKRQFGDTSTALIETGSVRSRHVRVCTAAYCSPEQASGEALDVATDIYSLGVALYELLTGFPPFVGETPLSVAVQHILTPPPPPRRLRPEIPPIVERTVLRALSKNPGDRFASADEMGAALDAARRTLSDSHREASLAGATPGMWSLWATAPRPWSGYGAGSSWRPAQETPQRNVRRKQPPPPAIFEAATAPLARHSSEGCTGASAYGGPSERNAAREDATTSPLPVGQATPKTLAPHALDPMTVALLVADAVALLLLVLWLRLGR